jgi:hypothetical protein
MIKLRREPGGLTSSYQTKDGRFRIWKEPYRPHHWYINEWIGEWGDAVVPEGQETLAEARKTLEELYREQA